MSRPIPQSPPKAPTTIHSFRNQLWLFLSLLVIAVAIFVHKVKLLQFPVQRVLQKTLLNNNVNCLNAHDFLTDVMPIKGFHVLCIETMTTDTCVIDIKYKGDIPNALVLVCLYRLKVTSFKNGMHVNQSLEISTIEFESFSQAVEEELLQISRPSDEYAQLYKQPPAYFTPNGVRLEKNMIALQNQIVFLFEGGQFIWPGILVGHKMVVENTFGRGDLILETISMTPLVFSVDEFLWDNEIDIILDLSLPHLAPSGVALQDGDEEIPATKWRTSTTYWLDSSLHPVVQDIDKRTADLVKVPLSHQESVQVLRYERTQHYKQHLDYFSPSSYRNSPDVLKSIEHGYRNRMITVFWYMSDVARGGHTNFARSGGLPPPPSSEGCTQGISVTPQKRKVVVFYNMLPNGESDPMSLHGGCPVEEGVKLSGNKWVWNKPFSKE